MDIVLVVVLASATAVATGFGVLPVYWVRMGRRGLGAMWGLSAGIMGAISVLELLVPTALGEPVPLAVGAVLGVAFVLVATEVLDEVYPHEHGDVGHGDDDGDGPDHDQGPDDPTDPDPATGHHAPVRLSSLSLLMFLVFTVHSAPEGIGIGAALKASAVTGGLVTFAIALHNVPEGTAVAVGLRADGVPLGRAFLTAVVTSLPQPLLAPLVFLVAVGPFLPGGLGFAGGAMLALVVREVVPEGRAQDPDAFWLGLAAGLLLAAGLHFALPVPAGV